MKFESKLTTTLNTESGYNFQNTMNEDNLFVDEEEGILSNEVFPKKWASSSSSSMMARQSIHDNKCLLDSNAPLDKRKLISSAHLKSRQSPYKFNNINYIDSVKYSIKSPVQNSKNFKSKMAPSADKTDSTFQASNSKQNKDKTKSSFQNSVKKSLNLMQESYRLSEKMQYMKLLQQQTLKFNSLIAPFTIIKVNNQKQRKSLIPVIDLTKEKSSVLVNHSRESVTWMSSFSKSDDVVSSEANSSDGLKEVTKVNSLQDMLKTHAVTGENLVGEILSRHASQSAEKKRLAEIEEAKLKVLSVSNSKAYSDALEEKLRRYMRITTPSLKEVEPTKEKYTLPELTKHQEAKISSALIPSPPGEILVEKFGLQIKRRDLQTLKGLNWLNDEVINFYMNLIMERGQSTNLPSVYAFNTFFYPKLVSSGHNSIRRWTKKVDIFSHDLILVPIHLGVHWCMAVIDFRSKEVRYYDSMGSSNSRCLNALLQYLEAESLDKKKTLYSTKDWQKINMEDIPQQMNGSDCGVFSCAFAEHLARDSPLFFSQNHMPYFRKKMALEILESKLLT